MKHLLIILGLVTIIGCSTLKEVPVQTIEKIEYRDSTIFIRDTIVVPVPLEKVVHIQPKDTTSVIATSLAKSEAKIEKGMLHHSLEQKGSVKAKIDTFVVVEYVDRVIEKEVPVKVEVEKKYIPQWCWWVLIYGIVLTLLTAFRIYLNFKK